MKSAAIGVVSIVVLVSGSFGLAKADSKSAAGAWLRGRTRLAGRARTADPKTDYKVVFADGQDAKNPGDINPMLPTIATYVNTLGKYGVPAEHRHIVIMFHQRTPDIDIVMTQRGVQRTLQPR